MLTLHILSRVATPHNNCLVRALRDLPGWRVITWYAVKSDAMYDWRDELGADPDTRYLSEPGMTRALRQEVLRDRSQRVLFVGYSEPAFRSLMLALVLRGRKFFYWTDHPQPTRQGWRPRLARWLGYAVVRHGAGRVFVVGRHTVPWFMARGFRQAQLENFPILIDLPVSDKYSAEARAAVRAKYNVPSDALFLVGGSRLIHEKGFDLLVDAVAGLELGLRERTRVLIVGKGVERANLERQAAAAGLTARIQLVEWMDAAEFEAVIAAADAFVHPSRFDAFGGGTLMSMAVGVPVIGSTGAGVVLERVEDGVNGLLFDWSDPNALARAIQQFAATSPERRREWGRAARATAERWTPAWGAALLRRATEELS
ncbi:MAG: glycosyltransferase family 4 protein [Alphaproteobacteria bacterium]|nr:glycosyltransferase family 4 protein [Alphaproteobacteria bacterium]